ncbi:type II secretion system F family protein [Adhaeretor mobilis]|uniref:Bacterial type II secretion system protein F domain protein n=1 Tax=Adhaeretor mobilis TaxID=1930276 RepID=A0A517MVR6_9BACT|nr:type II secretion system F family protein [Adhaeretor mobilis]QDS98976.1 Bacterial type II secretion system protein F domain protein [Adhaeretor mobilis]
MLPTYLIIALVFAFVTLIFVAVAMMMRDHSVSQMEDRLNSLTSASGKGDPGSLSEVAKIIAEQRGQGKGFVEEVFSRTFNLPRLFEQADVTMSVTAFLGVSAAVGIGAALLVGFAGLNLGLAPIVGVCFAALPLFWLTFRRKRRLRKFAAQLPDALELVARALRAGHSLAAGFRLVSSEGSDPIAAEFGRVFEEQNLGIPFEEALNSLCERVPNLDLKFFVTAVVLQRQTGGDLAEILDKIGHLIRERFKIWGQVQALTGEGRLSGIVLLALPPMLFVAVYRLNPEYLMVLFTDELGKKMLIGGVLMQLFGALVIRKIVNIRV